MSTIVYIGYVVSKYTELRNNVCASFSLEKVKNFLQNAQDDYKKEKQMDHELYNCYAEWCRNNSRFDTLVSYPKKPKINKKCPDEEKIQKLKEWNEEVCRIHEINRINGLEFFDKWHQHAKQFYTSKGWKHPSDGHYNYGKCYVEEYSYEYEEIEMLDD